tara:strand:+ start:7 stop:786 length:780 start_codon:yes stop_codon:yes gene_type:complete
MIKFFRKIRQDLLSKGKTGKYFKYAIGEIILVVIGILIALQINNWNENRKASKLEQSYYCLLLDDIEQDKIQIEQLTTLNNKRIEASNKAIIIIQNEKVNLKELGKAVALSRRDGSQYFVPNTSTYEDIKSSGNLNIIKNKNITKSLNRYAKTVEGYGNTIQSNFKIVINRVIQTADWFNVGAVHSNYKDIYPKEIQDNLSADLPKKIPIESKSRLYEDLVIEGSILRRRSELLKLINNEVDIVKSKLSKQCEFEDNPK